MYNMSKIFLGKKVGNIFFLPWKKWRNTIYFSPSVSESSYGLHHEVCMVKSLGDFETNYNRMLSDLVQLLTLDVTAPINQPFPVFTGDNDE